MKFWMSFVALAGGCLSTAEEESGNKSSAEATELEVASIRAEGAIQFRSATLVDVGSDDMVGIRFTGRADAHVSIVARTTDCDHLDTVLSLHGPIEDDGAMRRQRSNDDAEFLPNDNLITFPPCEWNSWINSFPLPGDGTYEIRVRDYYRGSAVPEGVPTPRGGRAGIRLTCGEQSCELPCSHGSCPPASACTAVGPSGVSICVPADLEAQSCDDLGGTCLASPRDVTFPPNCAADYLGTHEEPLGTCRAISHKCCVENTN